MPETSPESLLPELSGWNDGRGVPALDWLYEIAKSAEAVAYSELFWPQFVSFEGYILRKGFNLEVLRGWESAEASSRQVVETYTNILSLGDMFRLHDGWSSLIEQRVVYIGELPKEVHELKLRSLYPERKFELSFADVSPDGSGDFELTFWQA